MFPLTDLPSTDPHPAPGYKLPFYFSLRVKHNLSLLVQNFIAVAQEEEEFYAEQPETIPGYTRPGEGYQPFAGTTPPPPPFGGFNPGGTVGFDGSGTGGDKGGTIGM